MDNKEFFKKAGYGMMMHFGLYSLLAGEYKGKKCSDYAEWIQPFFRIPKAEYEQLASVFNPVYFNADEIIKFAKDCGMKYFVVTAKHHEGFALFNSKADRFNVCDATPFKRDILYEFAEACAKNGIKLGVYYSQDLDWHEEHGGGYLTDPAGYEGSSLDNDWDFPDRKSKDFSICFENKILPQVEEILRGYGDILLTWFDIPLTINKEQSKRLYELVKHYQPDCLVNSRIGNGICDYVSLGDNQIPETKEEWQEILKKNQEDFEIGVKGAFLPSRYNLYESACTLNKSWGFSYRDHNWISPEELVKNRKHLNGLGMNYLINVGPDHLGRIPGPSVVILKKAARIYDGV